MIVLVAVLLAVGVISKLHYLFIHSLLDCKCLEFTDSSFCVLGHLYKRSIGATVVERRGRSTRYESAVVADGVRHDVGDLGGMRRRTTNEYGDPSH
jgi:hypothetical protein